MMPTRRCFPFLLFPVLLAATVLLFATRLPADSEQPESKPIVPKGSETAGKTLFVEKGCYQCHAAGDVSLPRSELEEKLIIDLGGREHEGWSRDEFAREIMDPQHTVAPEYRVIMITLGDKLKAESSPMPGFNDVLTVSDLTHLATFLAGLTD